MRKIVGILIALILFSISNGLANNKIGIDEQLGKQLPLNLKFKDENGKTVLLKDLVDRPTVLDFVYFHCAGLCSPLMLEMAQIVGKVSLIPGKDYRMICISMDQNETPKDALEKKNDFSTVLPKDFPDSAWTFLTADSATIQKITSAAGFEFERKGNDFIHTTSLIFLSGDGKICRYLHGAYRKDRGFSILPFDFKMAVLDASKGRVQPTLSKILQFCFSYDPSGKTYVLDILNISGAVIIFLAVGFVVFLKVKKKKV